MAKSRKTKGSKNRKKREINLSDEEKRLIITAYRLGYPPHETAAILERPANTVSAYFSRYELDKDLKPKDVIKKQKFSAVVTLYVKRIAQEAAESEMPTSYQKLYEMVKEYLKDYPNEKVPSRSSIYRMLKDHNNYIGQFWFF